MTPTQALDILAAATEPQAAAQMTRRSYTLIEQALQVLRAHLDPPPDPDPDPDPAAVVRK